MADDRLRELERIWRKSGMVEDEARYLAERVRVGDLEQKKLELAAHFGDEAAQVLTGLQSKTSAAVREFLPSLRGLIRVRMAIALGRVAFAQWHEPPGTYESDVREVFELADTWLINPSRAGSTLRFHHLGLDLWDEGDSLPEPAHEFALKAIATLALVMRDHSQKGLGLSEPPHPRKTTLDPLGEALSDAGNSGMTQLREELVPWFLGYSDPVAERVKQREAENRG